MEAPLTTAEVAGYWAQLVEANRGRLAHGGNRDLIDRARPSRAHETDGGRRRRAARSAVTGPRPSHAAKRLGGKPTEDELRAARRIVSRAERRAVEEAEKLCQAARRMLDAASDDADRARAEADRVLVASRAEAQRLRDEAERVLIEARAEAERIRDGDVAGGLGRRQCETALSAVDPTADDVAVLRRLLSDHLSADMRLAAFGALARTSEPEQLDALVVALADPDHGVRAGALETLSVAATGRAAAQVLTAAEDDHDAVRAAAYRHVAGAPSWVVWMALGRCTRRLELLAALDEIDGSDRVIGLVLERMSSPDVADRILALELSGHLGTPELLTEAIAALTDVEAAVRRAAATRLDGCDEAVPGLATALRDDPDPSVRSAAARALTEVITDDATAAFVGALQDPHLDVRRLAVEALRRRSSVDLAQRLAAQLTSSNLDSVGEVLLAMPPLGPDALAAVVADGPPEPASAATELLKRADASQFRDP